MTCEEVFLINVNPFSIGRRQLASLRKIAAFCEDPELVESRQQDIRKECLAYWEIPDQARTAPPKSNPRSKVEELLKGSSIDGKLVCCRTSPGKDKMENLLF